MEHSRPWNPNSGLVNEYFLDSPWKVKRRDPNKFKPEEEYAMIRRNVGVLENDTWKTEPVLCKQFYLEALKRKAEEEAAEEEKDAKERHEAEEKREERSRSNSKGMQPHAPPPQGSSSPNKVPSPRMAKIAG